MDVRRNAALTRGNQWRFLAVAMLPLPLLLLLELVRVFLLQMPRMPRAGLYHYSSVAMLLATLVSVTTMSVSYRILALSPTDSAPGALARETAAAEG